MKENNIYLHIGHGKTGTSAVQSALAIAKDSLLSLGIYYPIDSSIQNKASKFGITSGNWSHISERSLGKELMERLKGATNNSSLLLSSEHLFWYMDSLFEDNDIDLDEVNLHVILAVRDVEEMLSSEYQQLVKRHGETRPFEMFLRSREFISSHHRRAAQLLKALKHRSIRTTVINYSKHKSSIAEDVFEVIGAKDAYPRSRMAGVVINRSLTQKELEILRVINSIYFKKYPTVGVRISDALVKAFPMFYSQKLKLSVESRNKLYEYNSSYVDAINAYLPNEELLLGVETFKDSMHSKIEQIVPNRQIREEEQQSIEVVGVTLQNILRVVLSDKIQEQASHKRLSKKLVDQLVEMSQSPEINGKLKLEILELASASRPKRKRLARLLEKARVGFLGD